VTYLLDVNVLIALIDPSHVGHDAAHGWFANTGFLSWATCPITENGVIRIVGHPKYPNSAGSPAAVVPIVSRLRARLSTKAVRGGRAGLHIIDGGG
jgi:predicted nucleic acid-binding protein